MANALPIIIVQWHAKMARNPVQMDRRIGRAANRRIDHDRIFKGLTRHHIAWPQVFPHHIDDPQAGFITDLPAFAIGRRNRCRAGQLHAQRFCQGIHRGGGAHRIAIANRGCGTGNQLHKTIIINIARGQHLACLPNDGARPGPLAVEPAIQHRPYRKRDGRDIHRRGRHEQRRGGFIAANIQHHAIKRIAK